MFVYNNNNYSNSIIWKHLQLFTTKHTVTPTEETKGPFAREI